SIDTGARIPAGIHLGEHPYGYTPHYLDLTDHLEAGKDNVLVVKVDRSRKVDSRWYPGAGIYRNVQLIRMPKLHIPIWGLFVSTPSVKKEEATVQMATTIRNDFSTSQTFSLISSITHPNGETIASRDIAVQLEPGQDSTLTLDLAVSNPSLWSTEDPFLYQAHSQIKIENAIIDEEQTSLGIRTFQFNPNTGFTLNGVSQKIKGVCLHQDGGLVGVAVPDGVWRRRLQTLKDGGCNAIRVSHHPASEDLLRLCDEMGLLVQDEFFDEWDNPKDKRLNKYDVHDDEDSRGYAEDFQEWAEHDLKTAILAHRNHPSIFQWSIGNEIEWTYSRTQKATGFFNNMEWTGNYFWSVPPNSPEKIKQIYDDLPPGPYAIEKTAQKLARWTREMDTTRPVTANCILPSASLEVGVGEALDIVGFSYRRVMYDYAHQNHPDKVIMGTENLGQWHEWKAVMERPFISGTFLWTGIDYMGESNEQWPRKSTPSGMLDIAGFTKPSYHMMKTLWQDDPHVYMSTQLLDKSIYKLNPAGEVVEKKPGRWETALWFWHPVNNHWNYQEGDGIVVEVISNCPEVSLFLNEKSLGTKQLADFPDRIYKWHLPFTKGELKAVGNKGEAVVASSLITADAPSQILLKADEISVPADGYAVVQIEVQMQDQHGHPVRHLESALNFSLEGPFKLMGVDNGDPASVQAFQSDNIITSQGRALITVQAKRTAGKGTLTVKTAKGVKATINFSSIK
ncbi:MAG: glycoside hydrolase family 2 TIM barrel-domain containing protein, partial [Bacteroidota bacterium]